MTAMTMTTTTIKLKNPAPRRVDNDDDHGGGRGGVIPDDRVDRRRRADFSPRVTRSMARGLMGGNSGEETGRGGAGGGGGGRTTAGVRGAAVIAAATAVSSTSSTPTLSSQVAAEGDDNGASSSAGARSSRGTSSSPSSSSPSYPVLGMTWNRFRPSRRRRWRSVRGSNSSSMRDNEEGEEEEEEVEEEYDEREAIESWMYSSQLIDRGVGHFLPDPHRQRDGLGSTTTSGSPLSFRLGPNGGGALDLLCVATTKEIHWYLRGRYRVLSVPHGLSLVPSSHPQEVNVEEEDGGGRWIDLVCSPDLGTLLACVSVVSGGRHTNQQKAKLFSTKLLPRKRFVLQSLSSSYESLFSRLWDVRNGICEALTSWRTTLRPLDAKFLGLSSLLSDYGVDGAGCIGDGRGSELIRLEFLKFILCGRSTVSNASSPAAAPASSSSTSALDQFFTRAQMHDTLLQREARMIESCASSTEAILRSHVLSVRAIVFETEELYGMAASFPSRVDDRLVDVKTALCLYRASRGLYLAFNQCLHHLVESRIRLHDLLAWLRGTAARVRAWGTAPDSIQRRNARALRVSNGVVQRVAAFLSCPMMFELKGCDGSRRILTECIIGVPISVSLLHA